MSDFKQETSLESGNLYSRKEKTRSRKLLLKNNFCDYITTLQGLRYVTDRGLSPIEKIFWIVIYMACVATCFYWMASVWAKWQDSPVIVTFNEQLEPAWGVPFPSVTICPEVKVLATRFNYTDIRKKYFKKLSKKRNNTVVSEDDIRLLKHFAGICKDKGAIKHTITEKYFNMSLVEDLLQKAPHLYHTFISTCNWDGKRKRIYQLFKEVLTEEGLCFNINSLPIYNILREESIQSDFSYMEINKKEKIRGWTVDGYFDPYAKNPYPRRGSGSSVDLQVTFYHRKEYQDEICNSVNTGFKVYIQQPQDMPRSTINFYSVNLDKESSFALKFTVINSSDNIQTISPSIRQCFFPNEKQLRYFKIYTTSNCQLECLTNRTFEICQCVFFYMPYHTSDQICTQNFDDCLDRVHDSIVNETCNCLPPCNTVEYEAEVIKVDYKIKENYNAIRKSAGYNVTFINEDQFAAMRMYYKQLRFVSMRRSQLFGFTEFLANCGGLLGLFLGFSSLSLAEMIYFVSLRLWCVLKKDAKVQKQKEKRGQ